MRSVRSQAARRHSGNEVYDMRRYAALFLFATLLTLWPSTPSRTQDAGTVVQTCGISPTPYTGGGPRSLTMDLDGHLCATAQGVLPFTNGGEGPSSFNTSSAELIEGFPTSTLNTINNWQAPTANGTGVAATNAATQTTLSSGTTTTSWSKLTSIKTFTEDNPGYMFFQTNINIQPNLGATSGGCVLFGYATLAASPTCSAPGNFAVNCVCFETTTDGRLLAVVYATSSRLTIVDLSLLQGAARAVTQTNGAGQPIAFSAGCQCVPQVIMQNSGAHRALIYFRGDNAIFALEGPNGVTIPIAYFVSGAAGPDINALPVSFAAAVGPATIGTAVTIQVKQGTVARTSARLGSLTPGVAGAAASSPVFQTSSRPF